MPIDRLGKHHEKIMERRLENGALIISESQRLQNRRANTPGLFSPEEVVRIKAFALRVNKECEERLTREMALVFGLSKDRTRFWPVAYATKKEAARLARVNIGGLLLDLDVIYGGMLVFGDHLFVSESATARAMNRYGSELPLCDLIDKLISEPSTEKRAA